MRTFFKKNKGQIGRTLVFLVLVTAPIFLFRMLTDKTVDGISKTISLQYSQELNEQMTTHIANTVDYYFNELNTEYNALGLIENLNEEKIREFVGGIEKDNGVAYLAFADDDGNIYEADDTYLGTMRVPILGSLLNGENRVLSDNETIGNESYIMVGRSYTNPINADGKTINIAIQGMNQKNLTERLDLQSKYSGGYSSIIHTDGSYIVKNTAEPYDGLNLFSILTKHFNIQSEEMESLKTAVKNGETYFLYLEENNNARAIYLYLAPIEGTEWYIANSLPSKFIKDSMESMQNTIQKIFIAFVVAVILVASVVVTQQSAANRKIKEGQVKLEKALKLAEEASGAKTAFLFSMSHDIRTPMNAILGYTDIGLKHSDDPKVTKDSYHKIKTAGGHLLNLINDILEMSRIESGKMELDESPADIRKQISDVTVMSQSLADTKAIDFKTVVGDIRNPYVYMDELHLNEVLINLISNAVKYTPRNGKVRFSVDQIDEPKDGKSTYRFVIEDNGMGMSEEFQKHLFETFSREENTTISKIEGTGLGLSIVKKIVDMAGGEIKVDSVQNKGSTFTVDVPLRIMEEDEIEKFISEMKAEEEMAANIDLSGKRVLLAEDNELNREIAIYILEEAGLAVDTAENGEIAVSTVIKNSTEYYDFILMDIQMPVMNGYEATRKIRELPGGEKIPIIALSANAFEEDRKKSIEEGMNAHVAKPIDIKILLETMQEIADKNNPLDLPNRKGDHL